MQCQKCHKQFTINSQVKSLMERLKLEDLAYCLDCGRQIRLSFWPFGNFYSRKDDLTGEPIITTYPPLVKFPVYKRSNWHSDNWEAPKLEYNFNKSFFTQFQELQFKTPHFHMLGDSKSTNCDYCDDVWEGKDCYLDRSSYKAENEYYSYRNLNFKDSIDITFSYYGENCYDIVYCFNSYNLKYSINCRDCIDSYFLYDCRNCEHCFMCWNLNYKKYYILNQKYSPEEYNEKIKEFDLQSASVIKNFKLQFNDNIKIKAFHKQDLNTKVEGCLGNFLDRSKNSFESYLGDQYENCYDVFRGDFIKECMGVNGLLRGELSYYVVQSTDIYYSKFIFYSVNCFESEYLEQCYDCKNCFGCIGLKRKQYCIFNKQFEKAEYKKKVTAIKEQMKKNCEYGQWLPQSMAYNGYNCSLAQFYYPLNKEEIKKFSAFYEDDPPIIKSEKKENIVFCEKSKRPFKLIPPELDFYQRNHIPQPYLHPDERNRERYKFMTAVKPQSGKCCKCQEEIIHYYPKEWEYQNILCNKCYNKEIL